MPSEAKPDLTRADSLQRRLDVLNQLVEVSLVMNSTFQLRPLLDYLMHIASEMTGAEAASIMLIDPKTGDLRFEAATGEAGQKLIGMIVPIEGSIAGAIIQEGRAMIIDEARSHPRHYNGTDKATDFLTRSILGVPMTIREKLVGVLEVINKIEGSFTEEDLWYITILASQAAVAIDGARMIDSLERAYEELNRLNKLKTDFIAIASHELRTPLSVILGYTAVLKDDAQGEMSAHIEAVLNSALQMRSLIEGMTNLRYVQIDENEMAFAPVDLREALDLACQDIQPLAQAKDQLLSYEPPEDAIPAYLDLPKAVMAFTNVLNNAVKFTPPGGAIIVTVERRPREVWVRVADSGYGLPETELERIFVQFYQVEDPLTRRHGGLGLGLTIARAIVERHQGRIWAESPGLGEGSCFTIVLPLAAHSAVGGS
jgi:signal transduction histidine kinase